MISSSPIWYLHDKVAFPDPKTYRPSRWLENDDPAASALRERFYIPFSTGNSACIGAQYVLLALLAKGKSMTTMTDPDSFAYLELYLSVSLILKSFHLDLPYTESHSISREASLPERLEWVAAVPIMPLEVCFRARQTEG